MRIIYAIATFSIGLMVLSGANAMESGVGNNTKGCQECHNGIESIRDQNSEMMQEIFIQGQKLGDPAGCIVCHGGDSHATTKKDAHKGKAFYPDPGSPWINKFTCGQCHTELVKAQWNSLMMTEAGKIQGATWTFGSLEGYEHRWGNYDAINPGQAQQRLGTSAYKTYMERLKDVEPKAFPERMTRLPEAPSITS